MTPNPKNYKPIPVEEAKAIAEQYDKSIVIIFSHDPVYGLLHTTTFGSGPQEKEWAAQGGEIATRALGGVVELKTDFEDYRLAQAQNLLRVLKDLVSYRRRPTFAILEVAQIAIEEAEKFLGHQTS
jgi:hypothetical protein